MRAKMDTFDFGRLVEAIHRIDQHMVAWAGKAINTSLTLRNWFMGFYIAEYELRSADRSNYGEKLLESLSEKL